MGRGILENGGGDRVLTVQRLGAKSPGGGGEVKENGCGKQHGKQCWETLLG